MPALWLFAFLLLERAFELFLSLRHLKALAGRKAREFHPETFPLMAALHGLFLLSLLVESHPWNIPLDTFTFLLLAVFVLLQGLRYWCIASLGEFWNTRIVVVPGATVQRSGPYRYLRHPNYLVVTLEFLVLPLLLRAPWTLAVFFPANLLVLRQRIRLEEKALREFTDYGERFP